MGKYRSGSRKFTPSHSSKGFVNMLVNVGIGIKMARRTSRIVRARNCGGTELN